MVHTSVAGGGAGGGSGESRRRRGAGGRDPAEAEGGATHASPAALGAHSGISFPSKDAAADPVGCAAQRTANASPSDGGADRASVAAPKINGHEAVRDGSAPPKSAPPGARGAAGESERLAQPSARERQEKGGGVTLAVEVAEGGGVALAVGVDDAGDAVDEVVGDVIGEGVSLGVAGTVTDPLDDAVGKGGAVGVGAEMANTTTLMRLLEKSATTTLPLLSTATPVGDRNEAPAPTPSANAYDPFPASVVTTPPGVTLRMRLLLWSATMTLPLLSTATP